MPTMRRTLVGLHLLNALSAAGSGIAPEPRTVFPAREDRGVLR